MSGYNTKQRRALLAFLGEHPDELLTAHQMADALAEKQISLSAVYRNLAQLEAEEKVRRSAKSGSHEAFYQYLDAKGCKGALHMSCVKCGKTFHMADSNAALFAKHLAQNEQFYACIISDATACCAEGMEFVLKDDLAYPDDYPELGAEITVIGEFQSYEENGMTWYHLVNARLA